MSNLPLLVFDQPELVEGLQQLGFALRKDPGALYGELRPAPE